MSEINKNANDPNVSLEDKCWELMSVLGMKWSETKDLTKKDREFLLKKVESIKLQIKNTARPNGSLG